MSLLETLLGGAMRGAGTHMIEEDQRKKDYADEKRRLAEAERLYRRNRKDTLADENRRLGRQVKEQYPDLTTNEMVTIYQNGQEERRPLRASELKQMEREDQEFEGKQRYQEAIINQMNRPSGGGGGRTPAEERPVSREDAKLIAEARAVQNGLRKGTPEYEDFVTTTTASIISSGVTRSDLLNLPSTTPKAQDTAFGAAAPLVNAFKSLIP